MARLSWADDFAHLHVASSHSLRYGVFGAPAALAARAAELGMPALALTDRDGLYGAVKHAVACAGAGIAPILGSPGHGRVPGGQPGRGSWPGAPAARQAGLVETARPGGARPAAPRGCRPDHSAGCRRAGMGVIVPPGQRGASGRRAGRAGGDPGSGCRSRRGPGRASRSCQRRRAGVRRPAARSRGGVLARWRERADVVIEIVDHHGPGDTFRAARMLRLARDVGVPAVLTNAVRYLDPADGPVAQVLDAARPGTPLGRSRRDLRGARAYLASGTEMARIAARICGVPDVAAGSARPRPPQPARARRGWIRPCPAGRRRDRRGGPACRHGRPCPPLRP